MLAAHVQFGKNLAQQRTMLLQAQAVAPKKFRGFTVAQLQEGVAKLEAIVALDDDGMRAHLDSVYANVRAMRAAK